MNDLYISMNAGEWSPLLTCRHDLDKRKAACKKLENMIVLEHGGIARRPGVIIQDSVADTAHRLIPFESSLVNAFVLDIRSGATDIYSSQGAKVASVASPWTDSALSGIQYVQVNDVMFLVHPNHPAQKFSWRGGSSFTMEQLDFSMMPQTDLITDNNLTITMSIVDQWWTMDATAQKDVFTADMVGTTVTVNRTMDTKSMEINYIMKKVGLYAPVSAVLEVDFPIKDNLSAATIEPGDSFCQGEGNGWYRCWSAIKQFTPADATRGNNAASYGDYFAEGVVIRKSDGAGMFLAGAGWRLQVPGSFYAEYRIFAAPADQLATIDSVNPERDPAFSVIATASSTTESQQQIDASGSFDDNRVIAVKLIRRRNSYPGLPSLTTDSFSLAYTTQVKSVSGAKNAALKVTAPPMISSDMTSNFTATSWSKAAIAKASYPGVIAFYQNRLWLGGMQEKPQTIYASKIDDYTNFSTGSNDDDGLSLTVLSQSRDKVCWMAADDGIVVGTQSGEWVIRGQSGKSITPSSFELRRQSGVGSYNFMPVIAPQSLVFVGQGATRLHEYSYAYDQDRYQAVDLSLLSEHVCESGIKAIAFQRARVPVIWCVLGNGELAGCTYNRQQQVVAWHRHILGSGWTCEAVAVIHDPRGGQPSGYDQVFVVIRNSSGRYLGRIVFNPDGAAWKDGNVLYDAHAVLMPADFVAQDGNTLSGKKRVGKAWLRIHEGSGLMAGTEGDGLTPVPWNTNEQGWVQHTLTSRTQMEACFEIRHSLEEAFTLLAINLQWAQS